MRRAAAEALGKIGPAAADAVPALTEALRDIHVRGAANDALKSIRQSMTRPS